MRALMCGVLAGLVALASIGCGEDEEAARERAEQVAELEKRAANIEQATKPGPKKEVKEPTRAELLERCENGDAAGCQGACILEDAASCTRLGTLFETGSGGVPENFESARIFHRKACDMGSGQGCYALALFYKIGKSIPRKPKRAKTYFKQGCDLGYKPACTELALLEKEN